MKVWPWVTLVILGAVGAYAGILLRDAGVFTVVESRGTSRCLPVTAPGFVGPEDMVETQNGRLIISTDDRPSNADAPRTQLGQALYMYDPTSGELNRADLPAKLMTDFRPHGMDLGRDASGNEWLYVINHSQPGDRIEIFQVHATAPFMTYDHTLDVPYINANDLVAWGDGHLYVTFDHDFKSPLAQKIGDYARQARGFVGYYDGHGWRRVGQPLRFANGIARLSDGKHLAVAAMLDLSYSVYQVEDNGDLSFTFSRKVPGGIDNMTVDSSGALWLAVHPNLLALNAMRGQRARRSPSQIWQVDQPLNPEVPAKLVLSDDGTTIAAASVGLRSKNALYVGSVFDNRMLVCPE